MRRMKYLFMFTTIASLLFFAIGCSSDKGGTNADGGQKSKDNGQSEQNETHQIKAIGYTWSEPPAKDGEGLKMLNDKLNINYDMQFVPESEYNEKLSAVMASGDIPDMIAFRSQGPTRLNYYKFAKQGAFMPLDDYIDDLEYKDYIPTHVWEAMKVDGKVYGIPTYYPAYTLTPMIRKDWLDNLGLEVPTNFEELKEVALAFTNDDPDGNGKKDTYGLVLGSGLSPDYSFGAYYSGSWYHKNDEGQYIPGLISEERKEIVEMLHDLYADGAVTPDFALMSHDDTNKEFYSGKAGIYYGTQYGMSDANMETLVEINPEAEVVPIPPFKAPDGSEGYPFEIGYLGLVAFSKANEGDTAKIEKMLEILRLGKQFIPWEERNPDNEDFDWLNGLEGKGYEMEDGKAKTIDKNNQPKSYLIDARGWPETPAAAEDWNSYKTPQLIDLVKKYSEMHEGIQHYADPTAGLISETDMNKGADLSQILTNAQSKMIGGDMSISDWNKMVEEYLSKGGQEVIDEYNEAIKENSREGIWE